MSSDWQFWRDHPEEIVVPDQLAVAVYINPEGELVIRQRESWQDHDAIVILQPSHAEAVARRLLELAQVDVEPLMEAAAGGQQDDRARARHLAAEGQSCRAIAAQLGRSKSWVSKALAEVSTTADSDVSTVDRDSGHLVDSGR